MSSQYTPMIQQYLAIKETVPDAFLFFRLGDFYEMFFEDALNAARELEITLTGRDGGQGAYSDVWCSLSLCPDIHKPTNRKGI